jgi:group I intron endonuclease
MAYNKETKMYEGYIYKIYNNVNNKIYIGQTIRTISERWAQHKSAAKTKKDNIALHIAMIKYGIDMFSVECVEKHSFDNIENLYLKLNKREVFYIDMYKSKAPNGYNISNGGSGVSGVNCRKIISYDPYKKDICHLYTLCCQ